VDLTVADFTACTAGDIRDDSQFRNINCDLSPQGALSCTTPACEYEATTVPGDPDSNPQDTISYRLVCDPAAAPWTYFYTRPLGTTQVYFLSLGPVDPTGTGTETTPVAASYAIIAA
jgi:hypothetical protein